MHSFSHDTFKAPAKTLSETIEDDIYNNNICAVNDALLKNPHMKNLRIYHYGLPVIFFPYQ